jgi:hypothetical protein
MSTARNLGLGDWNMGIGIAVIDSGINDCHDDLRRSNPSFGISESPIPGKLILTSKWLAAAVQVRPWPPHFKRLSLRLRRAHAQTVKNDPDSERYRPAAFLPLTSYSKLTTSQVFPKVRGSVIPPIVHVLPQPETEASAAASAALARSHSDTCVKVKNLGFTTSKHIKMYGERFEILSEPFVEGNFIAVRAVSGHDPAIRILHLPTAILVGLAARSLATAKQK